MKNYKHHVVNFFSKENFINFFSMKTLSVKGKINRENYIFAHFSLVVIAFLINYIFEAINPPFIAGLWMANLTMFMFMLIALFPLYVISIIASVKRLSDIKRPWYIVIPVIASSYIPFVGIMPYFLMVLILSVIKGKE